MMVFHPAEYKFRCIVDGCHRYLIVARELNTLVLELDVAMTEMEKPLFVTSETTVAAGELSAGGIAVQVTPTTIILAKEGELMETIRVDTNFPIAAASIVDPYIALQTQNGRLILYRLEAGDTRPHLSEVGKLAATIIHSVNIHRLTYRFKFQRG